MLSYSQKSNNKRGLTSKDKDLYTFDMEMDIDKLIGGNLRRIRKNKGLSQEKLSQMINVPAPRLSAYEKGRDGMGKGIMLRICKALDVHPFEFYVEPDMPIIMDTTEMKIVERMRLHPEIKPHCDTISRALVLEKSEQFQERPAIQKEKPTKRKEA